MDVTLWLLAALGAVFFAYLIYTGQVRWILGVVRNMFIGVVGMLWLNTVIIGTGFAVGVNAITVLVVGLLGLPGFLLLYGAQILVG